MVLITGFEGYGGRSRNPSEAVAQALNGIAVSGTTVHSHILPVDYAKLATTAQRLIDEYRPKVIISLGLWPSEPVIRLERVAINCADFEIPDNTGKRVNAPVLENGAPAHLTTLPIHAIRKRLLNAGIPCRLSGSAGTFLCNALMYSVLDHCVRIKHNAQCGFIHLPYLPEQVSDMLVGLEQDAQLEQHQRADLASMDLGMMIDATRLAITTALEESGA